MTKKIAKSGQQYMEPWKHILVYKHVIQEVLSFVFLLKCLSSLYTLSQGQPVERKHVQQPMVFFFLTHKTSKFKKIQFQIQKKGLNIRIFSNLWYILKYRTISSLQLKFVHAFCYPLIFCANSVFHFIAFINCISFIQFMFWKQRVTIYKKNRGLAERLKENIVIPISSSYLSIFMKVRSVYC